MHHNKINIYSTRRDGLSDEQGVVIEPTDEINAKST